MLEQLGPDRVAVSVEGDGAGDMVNAIGSRDDAGRVTVVAWNGTIDVSKSGGETRLDRAITLTVSGLDSGEYLVRHRRLDHEHSDINAAWDRIADGRAWPDDDGWRQLVNADVLADFEPPSVVRAVDEQIVLTFTLPMPAVSLLELTPSDAGARN